MQDALPFRADDTLGVQAAQEGAQMLILERSLPRHARERTPADKGERAGDDLGKEEKKVE